MKLKLAAAVILGIVVLGPGRAAWDASHIGAPDWYAHYRCPAGTQLKTWWVPAGPGAAGETYVWNGWRKIGGCAGTLTITTGG